MFHRDSEPVLSCVASLETWESVLRIAARDIRETGTDPLWIGPARSQYEHSKDDVANELSAIADTAAQLADTIRRSAEFEANMILSVGIVT